MKTIFHYIHKRDKGERGFTLIEMLVAVAIFSVVMLIAVGSLVSIIDANRKARTQKTVLNNLHAALETMSRNVREGRNISIVAPNEISFTDIHNDNVIYRLQGGVIERKVNTGAFQALTSTGVAISNLTFSWVDSTGSFSDPVPKLLITMRGAAGGSDIKTKSEFNVQSLISQRYRIAYGAGAVAVSPTSPNIVCPFATAVGRELRNFFEIKTSDTILFGGGTASDGVSLRPTRRIFVLDGTAPEKAPLPAGTYEQLGFAGFDEHCSIDRFPTQPPPYCDPDIQDYEFFFLEFYDAESGGNLILSTGITTDIPPTVHLNIPPEFIDTNQGTTFTLSAEAKRIEAVHGLQHPSKAAELAAELADDPTKVQQSIIPACVVLDRVGAPTAGSVEISPF